MSEPSTESELRGEVAALRMENYRLRKELAGVRAQRAEYLAHTCAMTPHSESPSESAMAEQMKHLIPADQVMRELDHIVGVGGGTA